MKVVQLKFRRLLGFIIVCSLFFLIGVFLGPSTTIRLETFLTTTIDHLRETNLSAERFETQKLKVISSIENKYSKLFNSLSQKLIKELTEDYNHDVTLYWSGKGSLHSMASPPSRPLFDKSCMKHMYHHTDMLDSVSIVICYRNELVYSLLRVLTAIDNRSPRHAVEEVVIIDDGSDSDDTDDIEQFGRGLGMSIIISRNEASVGIATCRHQGIRLASGKVIAILDSHIEVSDLWLQPLLEILHSKPRSIAVPLVDMVEEQFYPVKSNTTIDPYIFSMAHGYNTMRSRWGGPSEDDRSQPFPSPSLGGGAIVAYKSTLLDFYPKGITTKYLWGIENNRLAVRAWLCGDGIWIAGCSQVSHLGGPDGGLFRYGGFSRMRSELEKESLAEILNFMGNEKERSDILSRSFFTNMHDRKIRDMASAIAKEFDYESLCTKNYSWYLQNIHKGFDYKFFESPDFVRVGEIQSANNKYCLHCTLFISDDLSTEAECRHNNTVFWDSHMFGFRKDGAVHTSNPNILCWDAGKAGEGVRISQYPCHVKFWGETYDSQKFVYDEKTLQIRHQSSNRCVELVTRDTEVEVLLMKCGAKDLQKWTINKPRWIE